MKWQKFFQQNDPDEIKDLIQTCNTCLLITGSGMDDISFGVFNPIPFENRIYLHLQIKDQQIKAMENNPSCKVIFQDILGMVPSYWVDERYGGAATTFYRYAELSCISNLIKDPNSQVKYLSQMMKHFQPEGVYDPLDYSSPVYKSKIDSILICELEIEEVKAKWKLGQNKPLEKRLEIAKRFQEAGNLRCAAEIQKSINGSESELKV